MSANASSHRGESGPDPMSDAFWLAERDRENADLHAEVSRLKQAIKDFLDDVIDAKGLRDAGC